MDAVTLKMEAGGIALLTLNRPQERNAMSLELLDDFALRLREAQERPDLRVLVITGAGRHFCSGADFTALSGLMQRSGGDGGPAASQRALRAFYDAFLLLEQVDRPIIAAINGSAVGGGLGLALLCDLRYVAADAKLGANFSRLGIHPGLGITGRLPAAVGYQRAAELLFTGELFRGEEAARWGLCLEALPAEAVLPRALEKAARIAAAAPLAVRQIKRSLRLVAGERPWITELESFAQAILGQTADAAEGLQASLARREPDFKGK